MNKSIFRALALASALVLFALAGYGKDYLRMKDGKIVEGAILRQDTTAIFITDWDLRTMTQPPLKVYTRDEIESIWFTPPQTSGIARYPYVPHASGLEAGGDFSFQSWASTEQDRRFLFKIAAHGGISIMPAVGLELEAAGSYPLGKKADSLWHTYDLGYQVVMNVIAHPFVWKNFVPFVLAGGGASTGIPVGDNILDSGMNVHSVIDAGLGVKWGWNGVGYRVEWRHSYYSWSEEVLEPVGSPPCRRPVTIQK